MNLLESIQDYLNQKISFREFSDILWSLYLNDEVRSRLSKREEDLLEEVYNRETFSDKFVPEEDKKDGLMDEEEFRNWLLGVREVYKDLWLNVTQ